jgi:hypothetical protein
MVGGPHRPLRTLLGALLHRSRGGLRPARSAYRLRLRSVRGVRNSFSFQYDRQEDGTLRRFPARTSTPAWVSRRVAAIMQGVHT